MAPKFGSSEERLFQNECASIQKTFTVFILLMQKGMVSLSFF